MSEPDTRPTGRAMATAALELLASLDDGQRQAAQWENVGAAERTRFFYTPTDHGGLPLAAMSGSQQRLVHQLVATGLSYPGYVTMAAIMGLENILDRLEGWTASFNRARGRDPQLYWIAVFGSPGSGPWAWRFGGHHVSISYVLDGDAVVSASPFFLGADPASAPLLGPHLHRPLAALEDLARDLVHELDADRRAAAVVTGVAPVDIVGVNRAELTEGDQPLGLPLVWRGRLEGELLRAMTNAQRSAEERLGLTVEDLEAVAFTHRPKGLAAAAMTAGQRELLRALLDAYAGRLPDAVADAEVARYAGDRIDRLSFLWAGGIEVGQPHYYRIQGDPGQGEHLFVEYDNTQRDTNHIHTVWRDTANDFGRDALAEHYTHGPHDH